jgi:UDP-N-acetylglucosamine 2-epimerase
VIKAAVLAEALAGEHDVLTIDTGQHYDYELNGLLYEQLGIAAPTHCLDVGPAEGAAQTAAIIERAAEILRTFRPRAAVVIGDTNSTLGCTLAAVQLRIPVVHVEAGLRSGDPRMLEEANRRMVDAVAAVLCTPTLRAAETLRRESVPGTIRITGDVAYDALLRALPRLPSPEQVPELAGLAGTPFVLATLHRAELVDDPHLLADAVDALGGLDSPVLFAVHPRTRRALLQSGLDHRLAPAIRMVPPLGYLAALATVGAAAAVVTDSGGVQREAYWLGTPCVTLRTATEWSETIESGANRLLAPSAVGQQLRGLLTPVLSAYPTRGAWTRAALGDGAAAGRVALAVRAALGG